MPYFSYTAINREGRMLSGEGEFDSLEDLYYSLQREGLTLVRYSTKRSLFPTFFAPRIKRKELAEFLHNLSFLIRSGVPLLTAIKDLEDETRNKRLKKVLSEIRKDLLRGESLSEAIRKAKIFPKIVEALTNIGEASGNLDKTLEEASQHLYRVEEIISQTKRALIYPLIVILAMLGALAFWIFYVLPKILTLFKEMGIKLPIQTIILMKVIDFFQSIKFYLPLVSVTFIFLTIFLYKNSKTQIYADKVLLRVPIFGRIKKLNFLAFFFEYFSLLLRSGIDLLRILRLMKESFYRKYYISIVEFIEINILRGETISYSIKKIPIFRPIDIRMVMVGETTRRLDEQMKLLADFYYQEVKNLLDTLTKILEPLVLIIAGFILLLIIIALIGPVYELVSQIGKL